MFSDSKFIRNVGNFLQTSRHHILGGRVLNIHAHDDLESHINLNIYNSPETYARIKM
jgi:hypothetical protein